jgi:glycosyltransferase involved in cell wall biosynthesis
VRVLICATHTPRAPLNGAALVLRELIGQIASRHEITVIAYRWAGQDGPPPPGIALHELRPPPAGVSRRVAEHAASLLRGEPVDPRRLRDPMMRAVRACRADRTFDVAHVMLGDLASIAPALDGIPAIVAPLDAWPLNVDAAALDARPWRRAWLRMQGRLVRRYVSRAYRPYRRVVLVTREDADAVRGLDPSLAIDVVANGVDTSHFSPASTPARDRSLLLFTGALDFAPNARAARYLATEILPRVRRARPDARLVIAGRRPGSGVRALASQPGVEIQADVDDLRPLLRRAGVFACAMTSGTGIKNKLLEAMACGAPAVATSLGSRGLAARDGQDVLVADTVETFAASVARVLADDVLADRLARAARAYVTRHHSWDEGARCYEAIYASVVGGAAAARTASAEARRE